MKTEAPARHDRPSPSLRRGGDHRSKVGGCSRLYVGRGDQRGGVGSHCAAVGVSENPRPAFFDGWSFNRLTRAVKTPGLGPGLMQVTRKSCPPGLSWYVGGARQIDRPRRGSCDRAGLSEETDPMLWADDARREITSPGAAYFSDGETKAPESLVGGVVCSGGRNSVRMAVGASELGGSDRNPSMPCRGLVAYGTGCL